MIHKFVNFVEILVSILEIMPPYLFLLIEYHLSFNFFIPPFFRTCNRTKYNTLNYMGFVMDAKLQFDKNYYLSKFNSNQHISNQIRFFFALSTKMFFKCLKINNYFWTVVKMPKNCKIQKKNFWKIVKMIFWKIVKIILWKFVKIFFF